MKFSLPIDQRFVVGTYHEGGGKRAPQGMDGKEHRCIRGHFDGTKLDQTKASIGHERIEEFIDTDLGLVGVSMEIQKEIAKNSIDQRRIGRGRHPLDSLERHGKCPGNLKEALVNPGSL